MIAKSVEDAYGGTWGVVIVQNPLLISKTVHWAIPDMKDSEGVSGAEFEKRVMN